MQWLIRQKEGIRIICFWFDEIILKNEGVMGIQSWDSIVSQDKDINEMLMRFLNVWIAQLGGLACLPTFNTIMQYSIIKTSNSFLSWYCLFNQVTCGMVSLRPSIYVVDRSLRSDVTGGKSACCLLQCIHHHNVT